jgi:hypothetical protein
MKLSSNFVKYAGMALLVFGGMGIMYYIDGIDSGTARLKDLAIGLAFMALGVRFVLQKLNTK